MKFIAELAISTGNLNDSVGDGNGRLYAIDNQNKFRYYDLETLNETTFLGGKTLTGAARAVSLLSAASAVVGTSSSFELLELSTGYSQTYAGGVAFPAAGRGQTLAGDTSLAIALGCTTAVSTLNKFTGSTFTATTISPASLSGIRGNCIINRAGSDTWLVGTSNGRVIEMDSSGTAVQTIILPTTPNTGSAPTHIVTSLCLDGNTLYVATNIGFLFIYDYSSSTLIDQKMGFKSTSTTTDGGYLLAHPASGVTYSIPNITPTNGAMVNQLTISASTSMIEDQAFIHFVTSKPNTIGYDYSVNVGWVLYNNVIKLFQSPIVSTTGVQTEIQDPAGTAVAGRIVRLRDPGVGKAYVVSDQTVSAVETVIDSRQSGDYIEIALDSNGNNFGVRRFSC